LQFGFHVRVGFEFSVHPALAKTGGNASKIKPFHGCFFSVVGSSVMRSGANITGQRNSNPIAAWIYGRWHTLVRTTLVRRTALAFTLIFGIGGIWACRPPVTHVSWEPWSEARVTELLAQGKPVYVDFTACYHDQRPLDLSSVPGSLSFFL
jgi:hypothetical protein